MLYDGLALIERPTYGRWCSVAQHGNVGAGTHNITAVYGGDGNFTGDASAVVQFWNCPHVGLPLSGRIRSKRRGLRSLFGVLLSSLAAIGALTGCGAGSGFFGQTQQGYVIQIAETATSRFALQHFATVTLVLE